MKRMKAGAVLALAVVSAPLAAEPAGRAAAPVVDHHMHINSPAIIKWVRQLSEKMPEATAGMSEDIYELRDGAEAVRQLDRAGIRQGVLLSAAYMFASPLFPMEPAAMAEAMRAENARVVEAARASNGRLIPFVGINPFAHNALEELAYWSRHGAAGIKLHMGNSDLNLAAPDHVAKLASFFGAARQARLPIAVHLRGAAPYTADGVRTFIDKVLPQAGDLPVQIAHGGSYGGIEPITIEALQAYGDAIARNAPGTKNLVIELSAVALYDLSQGKDPDGRRKMLGDYVDVMRGIGMDRFVFGSDWPALHPPTEYFEKEREQLPVTDAEWADIADNRAPYLLPAWTGGAKAQSAQ